MAEEIIIEVDETGATKLTVSGCAGPSCKDLTRAIEKALGTVFKDTLTEEYHAKAEVRAVNKS